VSITPGGEADREVTAQSISGGNLVQDGCRRCR
jgi:hypothetical protein